MALRRNRGYGRVLVGLALFAVAGVAGAEEVTVADVVALRAAIDGADGTALTLLLEPGEYRLGEVLIVPAGVTLQGRETARTRVTGSGTLIRVSGNWHGNAVTLRNLTLTEAALGVEVREGKLELFNSVLTLGEENRALFFDAFSNVTVDQSVFYQNGEAIQGGNANLTLTNSIFEQNGVAVSVLQGASIRHNGFFANDQNGTEGTSALLTASAARFADPARHDFHLRADSTALTAGDEGQELGAWGGDKADRIPFPVYGVSGSAEEERSAVTVTWRRNHDHRVEGYLLRYGLTGAEQHTETVSDPAAERYTLDGLEVPTVNLPAPVMEAPSPANGRLELGWSAVEGASGYRLSWGVDSVDEASQDLGPITRYTLSGLDNEVTYQLEVAAIHQPAYEIEVAAYRDHQGVRITSAIDPESRTRVALGEPQPGLPSNRVIGMPEWLVAYPELPDEGCFIATAAFGHSLASQVTTLRQFRDRYLLTHPPGRALVRGYYRYSPAAAGWLNRHPEYKGPVRVALLPLVGVAGAAMAVPHGAGWTLPLPLFLLLATLIYRRSRT